MTETLRQFFTGMISDPAARAAAIACAIALAAWLSYYITEFLLIQIDRLVKKTETKWDDYLVTPRLLKAVSQLVPAIAVNHLLPAAGPDMPKGLYGFLSMATSLYILAVVVIIVYILVGNSLQLCKNVDRLRPYAIRGLFQMVQLVVVCIGIIVFVSMLMGRDPISIITAIGAISAVLMLVFKDTILGLVASIQLTANNMLREGDWIICDSRHVNGEVEDISLTTVKVRNWDNSVSTLPPYSLVSESFHNYQAMRSVGGRRVERSVLIDINSVRYLTPDELGALEADGWLDGLDIADAARTVNLGLLRAYLDRWLSVDDRINHTMLYMVRQMPPTATGLPLQLYFFAKATDWRSFEQVQSDMFDHVYAIINRFGLTMFQSPSGTIKVINN